MAKLKQINKLLQERLILSGFGRITIDKAVQWLTESGMLKGNEKTRTKFFTKLLREKTIKGQRESRKGGWTIFPAERTADIEHINILTDDILKISRDLLNIGLRIPPTLAGFYGELLVWKRLVEKFGRKGYKIRFDSGQSKADFFVSRDNHEIKVEVKTSRRKQEWFGEGYGFALNIKGCANGHNKGFNHPKRGLINGDFCYFDFLIAVLLDYELGNYRFYIFPREFIEKNEKYLRNRNTRFSSSSHRLIFPLEPNETTEMTDFDKFLLKKAGAYMNNWGLLSDPQRNLFD